MGKKKVRKDYGPYVEKTEEGRVVVTRRGYVAGIMVVALLVFGVVSKVVEIARPRPTETVQEAYADVMESVRDDLGFGQDTVSERDALVDSLRAVIEELTRKESDGVTPETESQDENE